MFFGPCAAKKNEADAHPDELALAIIFPALEQFLAENGIAFGEEAELALGPAEFGRHPEKFSRKLFVEMMACPGGCQNGPCSLA